MATTETVDAFAVVRLMANETLRWRKPTRLSSIAGQAQNGAPNTPALIQGSKRPNMVRTLRSHTSNMPSIH
jgi:hypothetical protein